MNRRQSVKSNKKMFLYKTVLCWNWKCMYNSIELCKFKSCKLKKCGVSKYL